MQISILTVFPELYSPFLQTSLIKRAQDNNIISCAVDSFRSFCAPKERIDAPTFGHGAGMLIRPEVVERAVDKVEGTHGKAFKIFFSPQGEKLDQQKVKEFAQILEQQKHIMLIAARYEGMDARVEQEYADATVSVGDFVLMGGDMPAMLLLEGLLRHIPGIVGRQESVEEDSFTGPFFDYPEYTEPVVWHEKEVPAIVRSGDHGRVDAWRMEQAVSKTVVQRFDWVRSFPLDASQKKKVAAAIPPHYVVLMHDQVMVGGSNPIVGTTSVTSLDIHDIARSAKTFGLEQYFLVTPLVDQQRIVKTLLDFWMADTGITYNMHRHETIKNVRLQSSFDEVLAAIREREGVDPIIIATSARKVDQANFGAEQILSYHDQEKIWVQGRPVLLVLGTGQGLASELVSRCDFLLIPIKGFSEFNHLSVRSAAAIIFDRWLGSNEKISG